MKALLQLRERGSGWIAPLLYAVASLLFTLEYVLRTHEFYLAELDALTRFTAARPFQYRVLIPLIVRGIQSVGVTNIHAVYYAITAIATFVALREFRWLLERSLKRRASLLAALALLWPLALNDIVFIEIYYPSDIAALAFYLVGIRLILQQRYNLLLLLLGLATLNRETSALIAVAFILLQWKSAARRVLVFYSAVMAAAWVAIKVVLAWCFRDNPGASFEWHLRDSWGYAKQAVMLDPLMIAYALFAFGGLHILSSVVIRQFDAETRALYWTAMLLVAGMVFIGLMLELRIFNEAVVGFTLSVVLWSVTRFAPEYAKSRSLPPRTERC